MNVSESKYYLFTKYNYNSCDLVGKKNIIMKMSDKSEALFVYTTN